MATVRISGYLKDQVENNIENMFSKRKREAKETYDRSLGKYIADNLYPEEIQKHIDGLPLKMFKTTSSLLLDGFYNLTPEQTNRISDKEKDMKNSMEFNAEDVSNTIPVLYNSSNDVEIIKGYKQMYGSEVKLDASLDKWSKVFDEYVRYNNDIIQIERQERDYKLQVASILDSYATLAPCLKVWEHLYELLPADIQEKHKEVKEKRTVSKAEDLQASIDTAKLTTTLVTSKLTGGKND